MRGQAPAAAAVGLLLAVVLFAAAPASARRNILQASPCILNVLTGVGTGTTCSGTVTTTGCADSVAPFQAIKCDGFSTAKFCFSGPVTQSFDLYLKDGSNTCPHSGCKWVGDVQAYPQTASCSPSSQNAVCKVSYAKNAAGTWEGTSACRHADTAAADWPGCLNVRVSGSCVELGPQTCKTTPISHISIANVPCCTCTAEDTWVFTGLPSGNQCKPYSPPAEVQNSVDTGCGVVKATTTTTSVTTCGSQQVTYSATCPGIPYAGDDGTSTTTATVNIIGGAVKWYTESTCPAAKEYSPNATAKYCPGAYTPPTLYYKQECDNCKSDVTRTDPAAAPNCGSKTYTYEAGTETCNVVARLQDPITFADTTAAYNYSASTCKATFTSCIQQNGPVDVSPTGTYADCTLTLEYPDQQNACGAGDANKLTLKDKIVNIAAGTDNSGSCTVEVET